MNCYVHDRVPAVGLCVSCQKAVCRECIGREAPRLVCRTCSENRIVMGFEYRSAVTVGSWPLLHICAGIDPATMRPRVAKGVIAIGNIAVGAFALGGLSFGLITAGGVSLGLLLALGGVAAGVGLSLGGVAVGAAAFGGVAVGYQYAIGGAAFGPAVIDGRHCDPAAFEFLRRWLGFMKVPPTCR